LPLPFDALGDIPRCCVGVADRLLLLLLLLFVTTEDPTVFTPARIEGDARGVVAVDVEDAVDLRVEDVVVVFVVVLVMADVVVVVRVGVVVVVGFAFDVEEWDCHDRKDAFDLTECTEPTVDTDPASLPLSSSSSSR
jgi:hypothetical protein